jgi:TolB-like protein/cytochrome c-type biogenesis protein CcmH/NrfG
MPTEDGSQEQGNDRPDSANTGTGRDADARLTAEQEAGGAGSPTNNWWKRFRAEFSAMHPEKQVAQIYYITAILALAGSIVAGIWAFGEHFWSGEPAPAPQSAPATAQSAAATQSVPAASLSIVVLPFVNLNGDPAQDYFVDGITESLTTDLSHALPGSFVVAHETAFTYKGKAMDARQIGRDLHVRYVLEGSVLQENDQARVNARLIDAQMGNEIWAERFDTMRSGIIRVQDEIVGRLSRAVGLQVISFEARRSEHEKPGSAEADDLVLRGMAAINRPSSPETMVAARDLFTRALKLQPDNIAALTGLATTYVFEVVNSYYETGNDERLQQAEKLLGRALALDDRYLPALKARAALLRAQGRFDGAIPAAQMVIAENPGDPWSYKEVGLSTMYLGRLDDALEWFGKAEQFGPHDPGRWTWLGGKGQALLLLGRDTEAIAALRAAIDSNPADTSDYAVLAAAYALAGHEDEAQAALARYSAAHPGMTVASFRNLSPVPLRLTDPAYLRQRERLKEGLRKASMPE